MVAKLFVANLSSRVHTRDLKEAFGRYGKVLSVVIKEGRDTYAFVEYDDRRDADDALDRLNGKEFYGKRIRVEFSRGHRSDGRKDDKCYVCGQRGHWAKECPEGSGVGVSDGKCFHCGGKGHIARLCKRKRTSSPRRSRSPYRNRRSPRRRSSSPRYRSRHSLSRSPRSESASPRRDLSKSPRRSLSRDSDRRSESVEYKRMNSASPGRNSIHRSPQQIESPVKERMEVIEDTNTQRQEDIK